MSLRVALLACVVILAGCTGAAPPTPTETASPLPTATETATVTSTDTPMVMVTATQTPTQTPTATPSPTPTATAISTPTPTPTPTPTTALEHAVRLAEVELWRDVKNDTNDSVAYELRATLVNDAGREVNVTLKPGLLVGDDGTYSTLVGLDRVTVTVPAESTVDVRWQFTYEERFDNATGVVEITDRARLD